MEPTDLAARIRNHRPGHALARDFYTDPSIFERDMERMLASGCRELVIDAVRSTGYLFVALDLEGFRSGSLNRSLGTRLSDAGERSSRQISEDTP